ncbi:MAG: AMP-binding protein, partial [Alphaproteobacteria bacterium]|nr:AMP-binding protein [Alphaproteobacteria bacterium]
APTPYDRFSQVFDLTFVLSMHDMFVCWASGACLYCLSEKKLTTPDEFIKEHELTFWFSTPSTAMLVKKREKLESDAFPSLSFSLFCGGELSVELANEWKNAAPNSIIENLYGPTEVTAAVTVYQYDAEKDARIALPMIPLGVPLSGQEVILLDISGEPVNTEEIGELCIGGDFLTPGCWNSRYIEENRFIYKKFAGKDSEYWYCTDSLACWNNEVGLIYNGKIKRNI